MDFGQFKDAIDARAKSLMQEDILFKASVNPDVLWDTYLSSHPENIRQQANCNTCKQFIKNAGRVVLIGRDLSIHTVWDVEGLDPLFQAVADNMASQVRSSGIESRFFTNENHYKFGHDQHIVLSKDLKSTITWRHFHVNTPWKHVKGDLGSLLSSTSSQFSLLKRGLDTLDINATHDVLSLIKDNELYRGEQHRVVLSKFLEVQREYKQCDESNKDLFCWLYSSLLPGSVSGIRNTSIGTLLIDLSEGKDINDAIRSYDHMMGNYRRPSGNITSNSQLQEAKETIKNLGLEKALERRHGTQEDIPLQYCFYVDRPNPESNDVFSKMVNDVNTHESRDKFEHLKPINMEEFFNLTKSGDGLEIFLSNKEVGHLMTLTSSVHDTESLFAWGNHVGWSYIDAMADSDIKRRVKSAGGSVTGKLRNSLRWFNHDDLDLHLIDPSGDHIYYGHKQGKYGCLDVDMNVSDPVRDPVENITYEGEVRNGNYHLYVNNFHKRESIDVGFEAEIEFNGQQYKFYYDKPVVGNVDVCKYTIEGNEIKFNSGLTPTSNSQINRSVWNLGLNKFHQVTLGFVSPNYWSEGGQGNKHYFFLLKGATPEGKVRPIFNEFLRRDLLQHHKQVFEVMGDRLDLIGKPSIGGLGFSVGCQAEFICKIKNSDGQRVVKVKV